MTGWNGSSWFLLFAGTALKSMAVLGAAYLTAILLRRRSAAARHLVWTAAFAALLVLPFLSVSLPAAGIHIGRTFLPPGAAFLTNNSVTPAPAPQDGPQGGATAPVESRTWRPDWRWSLMLLWAAGTAAALAQVVVAWAAIRRVRCTANRFTDPEVAAVREALGIQQEVEVLETGRGCMPMTFGLLRAAVFMPADAAEWSPERRRMVLLHELSHVRRGDHTTQMLARIALSFYWWNPLSWAAWRKFLKERERATDDLVLSAGARASEYASHLVEIARTMQVPAAIGWAAVGMARQSQLEGRLMAILDSGRNRKTPSRVSALVAALLAVGAVAPLAALQAQLGPPAALPIDVDASIRAAVAQKNPEMLEKAAQWAERLHKHDVAQRLLESALAIRAETSGGQSVDYALTLLKLGRLERRQGRFGELEALYTKAVSVLGNRPEVAPALTDLGMIAVMNKNLEQAIDYLQTAQLMDPAKAGPAMMWMALAREKQEKIEEAESLYKQALAIEGPNSSDAATTMELYALFLRRQGREEEANSTRDGAITLRKAQGADAPTIGQGASLDVYRAGNGVTPPVLITSVEPQYSEEARFARYEGTVEVYAEIGTDGLVQKMKVVRGLGLGLSEKAIEAISQWKFKPGTKDGQPVIVGATIRVNWRLL